MHPLIEHSRFRGLSILVAAVLAVPALAPADQQDAPAVDVGQLLQALRMMRQQQATQVKSQKQNAWQQISAAAGSNERATVLWEEAVRAVQMEGAGKENQQFKAWKDGEGEAFKEAAVQNAVRLHLEWLALTLQRSGGATVKDMLPAVIRYTQELLADGLGIDALQEAIKHEKELAANNPKKAQKSRDDAAVKKSHDNVLKGSLNNSVVVQWMKLGDFLTIDHWELNPGNMDGIYKSIILPEMRLEKDPRVFEYWDMKLKKEADNASKTKLAFEIDKFNNQRRPTLLWSRSQEFLQLGQKNRGLSEMFNLIKTYPTHPDADDWIAKLENLLLPPAPPTLPGTDPSTGAPPPASTALPGNPGAPTAAVPAKVPGL